MDRGSWCICCETWLFVLFFRVSYSSRSCLSRLSPKSSDTHAWVRFESRCCLTIWNLFSFPCVVVVCRQGLCVRVFCVLFSSAVRSYGAPVIYIPYSLFVCVRVVCCPRLSIYTLFCVFVCVRVVCRPRLSLFFSRQIRWTRGWLVGWSMPVQRARGRGCILIRVLCPLCFVCYVLCVFAGILRYHFVLNHQYWRGIFVLKGYSFARSSINTCGSFRVESLLFFLSWRAIRTELKHLQEKPVLQAMEKEMARDKPEVGTLRY